MSAKNKPTYELFCKGIMNNKRKGLRFDENGNVVCEPKAEFGADVDVDGKLTINSVKDLLTKDGTSLGLPSPWIVNDNFLGAMLSETQMSGLGLVNGNVIYIVTHVNNDVIYSAFFNAEINEDFNTLFIVDAGTDENPVESVITVPSDFTTKSQTINLGDIANIANKQDKLVSGTSIKTINGESVLGTGNIAIGTDWKDLGKLKYQGFASDDVAFGLIKASNSEIDVVNYGFSSSDGSSTFGYFDYIPGYKRLFIFHSPNVDSTIMFPNDFFTKSQVVDLGDINTNKTEIAKKQSTLYRHTIDIDAGGLGLHTYVTALSEKNTVIDSIQDLVTVFGNTKLMATGQHSADSRTSALVEVGTSLTNTYVYDGAGNKTSLSHWSSIGPNETHLEITDNVTPM